MCDIEKPASPAVCFPGGAPPGITFQEQTIRSVAACNKTDEIDLCFIGLIAYAEAFFKNQFAVLINIRPQLLSNLDRQGCETRILASDLMLLGEHWRYQLGFLVAERLDFGSAKAINALYHNLLLVTPFSTDETVEYDRLLNDRNLLVHHGGFYTMKYSKQRLVSERLTEKVFWEKLALTKRELASAVVFLDRVAYKVVKATYTRLVEIVGANWPDEALALAFLPVWRNDTSDGLQRWASQCGGAAGTTTPERPP